jgi:hypothetical protein
MNLIKIIEKEHSARQRDKVIAYVGDSPARFKELVQVFLQGPYRITQRASWPLSCCVEQHPALVKPHLRKLLQLLQKENAHDAVKRNILRLLQFIDIPISLQGVTAEVCFKFLQDTRQPIAVRVFAMTVLANIATRQPELKRELKVIIEDQLPYGSAGFRSRAMKILATFKE